MAKTVLVVDDAQFMRTMLSKVIEDKGYEVVAQGANGEEGVELYKEHNPDIVTMDITMPIVDGIEATKEIMAHDPNASIIMCSAMGQKPMIIDAIDAGAKDFIVKPIQPDKVAATLEKILE